MNNYCAFSKQHKGLKWMDYKRITILETLLNDAGIEIPHTYLD